MLIIFFHFIEKHENGVSFLKHSVFVFSSYFMCVTRISSVSSVPLLSPNPGDATVSTTTVAITVRYRPLRNK